MKLRKHALAALFVAGSFSALAAQNDLPRTLDDLQKAVAKAAAKMPQSDKNGSFNADQYFSAIRAAIERGEYSEVERTLTTLRTGSFADQKNVIALIDEAIAGIHAQAAAKESALDRAVETLSAETRAKIESHAPAKDFDAAFEKLSSLSVPRSNYGYNNNDNSPGAKVEALRTFISRWQDYLTQTNQGNAEQATNALNELITLSARMPVVPRSELLALQGDVAKLREAQQTATNNRFAELATRMQALVDAAKSAADLDGFLVELSKARPSNDYQVTNRLDQLRQFVTKWQEYLVRLESGNTNAAQEILKALANDSNVASIYPRSRLLDRLVSSSGATATPPKLSLPAQITFENLGAFAGALPARSDASGMSDFRLVLNELINARKYLQNGDPNMALSSLANRQLSAPEPYTEGYADLRRKVILESIVSIIKPPENMRPKADESSSAYLHRLLDRARDTSDWQSGYSVLTLMLNTGERNDKAAMDLIGYRQLVSAANFETAGQFAEAVQCYLSSLRSGGPNVPAAEIGRKLKTIKEAHPKEFEVGEKTPEPVPASAQDPRFRPGMAPYGNR